MTTLQHLDDTTLMDTLGKLVQSEREATADLLVCLSEVDRRKLYAKHGYSSLFSYCQHKLNMAEPSIYVRIAAARCCARFPSVGAMVRTGALHLSAVKLLAPHLTDDNCAGLLQAARNKSKRQVEEIVSDLAPKPDVTDAMRKVPMRTKMTISTTTATAAAARSALPKKIVAQPSPTPSAASPHAEPQVLSQTQATAPKVSRNTCHHSEPLGHSRYKVHFTADARLHRKIERAQELMRHKNPSGDFATLFEAAIDQFIEAENKRQHAATERPQKPKPKAPHQPQPQTAQRPTASRHIPNDVKRQVFARDGGQCTFVSQDGHRCAERGRLQYHHEVPFAKGGTSTVDNIRLLCACHNGLLAREDYGDRHIDARIQAAQKGRDGRCHGSTGTGSSSATKTTPPRTAVLVPLPFGSP